MFAFRRGLRLVSWRTAFGDASELDAQNQTRADFMSGSLEHLTPGGARFPAFDV